MTQSNKTIARIPWWAWVAGIDLFLVTVTTLKPYLPASIPHSLVAPFDLAIEMNLAAWFSGISLLALALLAYEVFSTGLSGPWDAWLVLAALLALLSLDEIGSLHERAGGMTALIPYIALIALLLVYAFVRLILARQHFELTICLAIMFALFGFVIIQEKLEFFIAWPAWSVGIRVGLEEGSELLGMFLGFWGFARLRSNRADGPASSRNWSALVPNPRLFKGLIPILAVVLGLHVIVSLGLAANPQVLKIGKLGNPAVWYPAVLFVLLACLTFWMYADGMGRLWLLLSGFALICSLAVIYLASPRPGVSNFYHLGLLFNFYLLSVVEVALFAIIRFRLARFEGRATLKGASVYMLAALLTLLAWISGGWAARWIVASAVPFLILLDFQALRAAVRVPFLKDAYEPVTR